MKKLLLASALVLSCTFFSATETNAQTRDLTLAEEIGDQMLPPVDFETPPGEMNETMGDPKPGSREYWLQMYWKHYYNLRQKGCSPGIAREIALLRCYEAIEAYYGVVLD